MRLKTDEVPSGYPYRKVWRAGLEVAMKIKGSQGRRRVEWVRVEHPFTAISPAREVHANHNEAQNSALRRRASAYRRRQNLYAKRIEGLQRVLDVQRLMHNWVRPHWGLKHKLTPAMAMGYCQRPISIAELLTLRGTGLLTGDEPLEAIASKDFRLHRTNRLESLRDKLFKRSSPLWRPVLTSWV